MSRFHILKFWELYRQYPCLWDRTDPDFKVREKRDAAELVLMSTFGIATTKELRAKIRSLRCTYNQEVAKVIKSQRTDGTGKPYKPKLSWFEYADSFLKKNREGKEEEIADLAVDEWIYNHQAHDDDEQREGQHGSDDDVNVSAGMKDELEKRETLPLMQEMGRSKRRKFGRSRVVQGRENKLSDLQEAVTTLRRVSEQFAGNEFAVFGQHVGIQLSKLPLPTALLLQREIQELITQARLNSLQPSVPISEVSPSTPISVTPSLTHLSEVSETSFCETGQTCNPTLDPDSR